MRLGPDFYGMISVTMFELAKVKQYLGVGLLLIQIKLLIVYVRNLPLTILFLDLRTQIKFKH